jgi:Uncharacterised protein family (UPF0158)
MTVAISKDDIFSIIQVMNSNETGILRLYGYIDLLNGEVMLGTSDSFDIFPDEEDEAVERFESRYLPIPNLGSDDAYEDMVNFVETVEDVRLRDLLEIAIQGKGAFGRFKNILKRFESEESRWFNFSAERETNRAIEWLSSHGLTIEG